MRTLKILCAFVLLGLVAACTKNDEPLALNALTLKDNASSTTIPINRMVSFSVSGDNYIDYTVPASLYVNDSLIEGTSYTFLRTGDYQVKAKFKGVTSNIISFDVQSNLIIDRKSLLKNQVATFSLYDINGENIASTASFYVNGSQISGHTFSSPDPGTYEVYAQYQDENGQVQTTDTQDVKVVEPTQRALIEDYTGTWCGYCPRLQGVINEVLGLTDDVVIIELHASSSDVDPDPFAYEYIDMLVDAYNPYKQFPTGRINRTIAWNDNDPNTVMQYVGGESPIGIGASTTVSGTQLTVNVRVASTNGLTDRKIVVAMLENDLFHDQANYLNTDPSSPWYGAGNPIPNYENDHVMRHAMTNIFGDPIPNTSALDDFTHSYSMDLADYCKNPVNAEVAIFVLDSNGAVLQVKRIGLNQSLGFE